MAEEDARFKDGQSSAVALDGAAQQEKADAVVDGKEVPGSSSPGSPVDDGSANLLSVLLRRNRPPFLVKCRSHVHFITLVVGYGIFVDLCIYGLASPIIPFRLRELGYENVSALTGWLVAAYGGGLIVSSPVIGWAGERIQSRQWPLLAALVFMAGALVMFALSKTFALLAISRILQGFSGTGVFTLGFALLADCVPEDQFALAAGNAMIGMSIGGVVGPTIGGALYSELGYWAPWIFSLIIVAVDFVLRILIIEPYRAYKWLPVEDETAEAAAGSPVSTGPPVRKPTNVAAFLKVCVDPRAAVSMMISFALGIYIGGVLDSALTLRLNQRYGLNSLGAGLVFIANAVPSLVFSPLGGLLTDRFGPRYVALVGVVGLLPMTALLCIDSMNLAAFVAVLALIGTFAAFPFPALSADLAAVVRLTPGLGYAHVFSLFNMAFSIGAFVGPIIAGQVLESLGIEKGWYTMLGVTIGCYVVCIPGIILKYSAHKLDDKQVTTAETLPTHTHTGETE